MSREETLKFYRRQLPHWIVANKSYFVTIRQKDTLPKNVIEKLRVHLKGEEDNSVRFKREYFKKIETYLDQCSSEVDDLSNNEVAKLVSNSIMWLSTKGWTVHAATVMPNHIHLLLSNSDGQTSNLLKDLGEFKRYTAWKANEILGRTGHFWAREDFDHWIRTNEKFEQVVSYIANNPVKANLVKHWTDWEWTYIEDSVKECIKGK